MTEKLRELYGKRSALVKEMRGIIDIAESEKRSLSADEREKYDRIEKDVDAMGDTIKREERVAELESGIKNIDPSGPRIIDPAPKDEPENRNVPFNTTAEYRTAFNRYLKVGLSGLRPEEERALQVDSDSGGGYTVASDTFINQLIKSVDDTVYLRGLATTFQINDSKGAIAVSLDNDPDDIDWTYEIGTGSEDSTMSVGQRSLKPHPMAKRIKLSRTLIRQSSMDIEQLVADRLSYKVATTEENAFMTGTGDRKPLGVFTASDGGITTSRDISTGNTETALSADGLINAKYAIKQQYAARARWVFHRDTVKMIRKLKDGNGDYIWRAGLATDRPDTILDVPYLMSEFAPNTFTSGNYVGIIGDFQFYWIVDSLTMEMQVLNELYAETNQIGYIIRRETDAMPVLAEAFARVTLA